MTANSRKVAEVFLIMKANEMHYFSDLFDKVLYIFRTCPPSIIRSISTLYTRNRYLSFYLWWRLLASRRQRN